ncbi:DnaJ family domain-containing protein [Microbacterium gorillae]|uniref:DnaJ family domain-containing protein n=1 Tax=Microbacterium gorillae TaxID=1231063 RepID=UPI00058FB7E3|nr:DUF1992 domain-containing protein [Microbacterium gorillae]
MSDDPRTAAARYLQQRADAAGENQHEPEPDAAGGVPEPPQPTLASASTATDRAAVVETAIQQAIRAGAFDDLPGAGKPIPALGTSHDPDWWIRRKIQTEDLRGLGPVALTLRVEDREFADRLDALSRESEVRDAIEDFNARVKRARMQLEGGPPVVTALRDVEAEVAGWRERRTAVTEAPSAEPPVARRRWFRRG